MSVYHINQSNINDILITNSRRGTPCIRIFIYIECR